MGGNEKDPLQQKQPNTANNIIFDVPSDIIVFNEKDPYTNQASI